MFESIKEFINSGKHADLRDSRGDHYALPTLWLLGKTGAGKSSLIQSLTGLSEVEVGNGFAPCTMSAYAYGFPQENPVLRFLDTRGLGEANYDPSDDIGECQNKGHALLVVAKIEEPEQSALITALKQIRRKKNIEHVLVIHTAVNAVDEEDRQRMQAHNQAQFDQAWGKAIPAVAVDFDCRTDQYHHRDTLIDALTALLPIVGLTIQQNQYASLEEQNFAALEHEVLWYAGTASASDLMPVVGLVSVPAIQAKMLHSLANQYGVEWNTRTFSELVGTLGTSVGVQYGTRLGVTQLAKLIPGYGQTAGAVTAAAVSFGATYGLGRAASYYFHHKGTQQVVCPDAMRRLYKEAFTKGKRAASDDKQ
ncbi:YcjF family protein [Vibrio ostreicida]|uniref:YcjF family protein n=1 Tax=Vibrio ostreicida TaxID=526588 RepID=UPI0009709899|nr:GTPase [Vibrio ostreicida]